jgi:hypothetical protein
LLGAKGLIYRWAPVMMKAAGEGGSSDSRAQFGTPGRDREFIDLAKGTPMKAILATAAFMAGLGLSDRWPEIWMEALPKAKAALSAPRVDDAPRSVASASEGVVF